MTNRVFTDPRPQQTKVGGAINSNGKLYFYEPGPTSTTLKTVYSDPLLTQPLVNPVLLDDQGRMPTVYMQESDYAVRLTDSSDVQIWRVDNYQPSSLTGQFNEWDAAVTYAVNDYVRFTDGKYYVSLQSGNVGRAPNTSPTYWSEVFFLTVWNSSESYSSDDIVIHNGILYTARFPVTGTEPGTEIIPATKSWLRVGEANPKTGLRSSTFTYLGRPSGSFDATVISVTASVGPTGSGADHIWTELDALPATASAVKVAIGVRIKKSAGTDGDFNVSAGVNVGSSASPFYSSCYAYGYGGATAPGHASSQVVLDATLDENNIFLATYNDSGTPDFTNASFTYLGYLE